MAVIQQVYFTKEGYSIYIKAIKPDEDNPDSGTIWINGNPTRLEREERYHIDSTTGMLLTDSYQIPLNYIYNFLACNGCFEDRDGKTYIVLKEVKYEPNIC